MKNGSGWIVLSYGIFLGWLLSFPYNGPVLLAAAAARDLSAGPFSLTYTIVPALFLTVFSFSVFTTREEYKRIVMIGCLLVCLAGTLIIFLVNTYWWFPVLSVMGVCSVTYIIYWSIYYTRQIPVPDKMKIMALVIITGNVIYYFFKLSLPYLSSTAVLLILTSLLLLSLWTLLRMEIANPIQIPLESAPFPTRLIFIVCIFLFAVKLNGGLTFHVIYPSFDAMFGHMSQYYGMAPYILTLFFLYLRGHKLPKMLPVYLGTSFLGLAYLFFGMLEETMTMYFLTETLLQAGWAMLHLFLWTLFGEIASVYGRPLKICSLAFLSNLSAMVCGGILGIFIVENVDNYYLMASTYAIFIVFICFLIVHWLNNSIEKDFIHKIQLHTAGLRTEEQAAGLTGSLSLMINLPDADHLLTQREMEVAGLLLQGYTNETIANRLNISKNTIKSHTRSIYSKMSVANKRELLQLACKKEN